ncbi:MAG: hypothetical protein WBN96_10200 [Gammaproteobacteria bacterium]
MLSLHRQCHFWISSVFVGAWLVARENDELTIKYLTATINSMAAVKPVKPINRVNNLAASARLQLGVCR